MLSPEQKRLVGAVVSAIEAHATDIHAAVRAQLGPRTAAEDIEAVLGILALPSVRYQRGMAAGTVIARIYDALDAAAAGGEYEAPEFDIDDRY